MDSKKPPHVSPELIKWLEEHFPDRCPKETDSDRRVWMSAGAVEVVKHLRALFKKQESP